MENLTAKSFELRQDVVRMVVSGKAGHIGGDRGGLCRQRGRNARQREGTGRAPRRPHHHGHRESKRQDEQAVGPQDDVLDTRKGAPQKRHEDAEIITGKLTRLTLHVSRRRHREREAGSEDHERRNEGEAAPVAPCDARHRGGKERRARDEPRYEITARQYRREEREPHRAAHQPSSPDGSPARAPSNNAHR